MKIKNLSAIFVGLIFLMLGSIMLLRYDFSIIGRANEPFSAWDIHVEGDYAYLTSDWEGLVIIDITDPTNPTNVGQFNDRDEFAYLDSIRGVYVVDDYAYLSDTEDGLKIIDVSDPTNPYEVGNSSDDGGYLGGLFISTSYAFVTNYTDGLGILDISDPTAPIEVGYYDGEGYFTDVFISGSYAFLADYDSGLEIIDISDPTAPLLVGQFDDGGQAWEVYVSGSYAFIAAGDDGLVIIDISDPTAPVKVGHFDDGGSARSVRVSGSYAYVYDWNDGLEVIDVSNPSAPVKVKTVNYGENVTDQVYVAGKYVYVAGGSFGLLIIDPWSSRETISNIISWGAISFLTLIALVDLRYLVEGVKPFWKESLQRFEEVGEPYRVGEKSKGVDLLWGFLVIFCEMVVYWTPQYFGLGRLLSIFPWYDGYFGSIAVMILIIVGDLLILPFLYKMRRGYIGVGIVVGYIPISYLFLLFLAN